MINHLKNLHIGDMVTNLNSFNSLLNFKESKLKVGFVIAVYRVGEDSESVDVQYENEIKTVYSHSLVKLTNSLTKLGSQLTESFNND